ncbi:MAG: HAMP domain-containing histidine kinase [Proteobacteria bacterium]|nr:HAMP domain-containing histidine kinase [Pseudomonadota bacterium]
MEKIEKPIRHSIRFKIFMVSLLPTLALLAAALLNNQYLNSLGESAEQILSKNYKSIRKAQSARKSLEEIRNYLLEQMSQNRDHLEIPQQELLKLKTSLAACASNITEVGENELTDRLMKSIPQYEPLVLSLIQSDVDSWNTDFPIFLDLSAQMVDDIDNLVGINEEAMEKAEQRTKILAGRAQRNAVILFTVIIIAILVSSWRLSNRIARPIMTLAQSLSKTKEGSGVYPKMDTVSNDEIGFLTDAFNHLFNRLEQYDRYRDDILAAEKEKVRRSEEAKGRFIADISHQLKTPMTSLAMSIGMLKDSGERLNSEKRTTLVATAHEDCSRLSTLINELVDISRLETMSEPRPKETLNIEMVIRECLAPLIKQAETKGVTVNINISENLPLVTIDSFRFPWVITNLIGNALRYIVRGGQIELKVYKQGHRFCFQCMDTGSGIDPHYLPHIFDRYTQFSERGKSGTIGLGLAIVKDIIEQHGGDVEVESMPGKGTTFTFWIPDTKEETIEKSTDR